MDLLLDEPEEPLAKILGVDWLAKDLARVDAEIEHWSPGIRESFDLLYCDFNIPIKVKPLSD